MWMERVNKRPALMVGRFNCCQIVNQGSDRSVVEGDNGTQMVAFTVKPFHSQC
jgi:hypothetical protein